MSYQRGATIERAERCAALARDLAATEVLLEAQVAYTKAELRKRRRAGERKLARLEAKYEALLADLERRILETERKIRVAHIPEAFSSSVYGGRYGLELAAREAEATRRKGRMNGTGQRPDYVTE